MKKRSLFAIVAVIGLAASALATTAFAANYPGKGFFKEKPGITEEQKAEFEARIKERIENGDFCFPGFKGKPKITEEEKAEFEAKIRERFDGGEFGFREKPSIMGEPTEEQLAEMRAKMEEFLSKALEDGKITQEQYDAFMDGEKPYVFRVKGEIPDFGRGNGEKPEFERKMRDKSIMPQGSARANVLSL